MYFNRILPQLIQTKVDYRSILDAIEVLQNGIIQHQNTSDDEDEIFSRIANDLDKAWVSLDMKRISIEMQNIFIQFKWWAEDLPFPPDDDECNSEYDMDIDADVDESDIIKALPLFAQIAKSMECTGSRVDGKYVIISLNVDGYYFNIKIPNNLGYSLLEKN